MIGTVYKYISINVRAVQRAESHGFYISEAPNDCCFESILFKGLNCRNFSVLVVKKSLGALFAESFVTSNHFFKRF